MSAIAPPHLRREAATQKQHQRIHNTQDNIPLKQIVDTAPTTTRLKSRKPFYKTYNETFDIETAWKDEWNHRKPRGGELIEDPTKIPLPGFQTLTRKQWTMCNRIRSKNGRTASNLHRWGYVTSPNCPFCNDSIQTMDHIITSCPATSPPGGYEMIHEADEKFMEWLDNCGLEMIFKTMYGFSMLLKNRRCNKNNCFFFDIKGNSCLS